MRRCFFSSYFNKNTAKLKGLEMDAIVKKVFEIASCKSINYYKNLKGELKKYKRVHVNKSYVILFFGDDETVYFVNYKHHDEVYKDSKKDLKKYESIIFEEQEL